MKIESFEFAGEGMGRVYENGKWTVVIRNHKQPEDRADVDVLERCNETDRLFTLITGTCTLVYADIEKETMEFVPVPMEIGKVYNIPRGLWHNALTVPGTKLLLIENSSTGISNSVKRCFKYKEVEEIRRLIPKLAHQKSNLG